MADVYLDDEITTPDEARGWGFGIDAATFRARCEAAGPGPLCVKINSPGGVISEGLAIYNHLQQLRNAGREVVCVVEGWAASMASAIACAGTRCEMHAASLLMVHNPWTFAAGDLGDMKRAIGQLDADTAVLVQIYQGKTGLSEETVRALMAAETWMVPTLARELKFADAVIEEAPRTQASARWQAEGPRGSLARASWAAWKARPVGPPSTQVSTARGATTTSPGATKMADPKRLNASLIALSGLQKLAQEGAASADPAEAALFKDIGQAVLPMASAAQQLLEQADPEGKLKARASLADLVAVHAAAAEVVGTLPDGAGLAGALRGLKAQADSVALISADARVAALVQTGVEAGQIHPDDRAAYVERYKGDDANLSGFLAVAPKVHAKRQSAVQTGDGDWKAPEVKNGRAADPNLSAKVAAWRNRDPKEVG